MLHHSQPALGGLFVTHYSPLTVPHLYTVIVYCCVICEWFVEFQDVQPFNSYTLPHTVLVLHGSTPQQHVCLTVLLLLNHYNYILTDYCLHVLSVLYINVYTTRDCSMHAVNCGRLVHQPLNLSLLKQSNPILYIVLCTCDVRNVYVLICQFICDIYARAIHTCLQYIQQSGWMDRSLYQ